MSENATATADQFDDMDDLDLDLLEDIPYAEKVEVIPEKKPADDQPKSRYFLFTWDELEDYQQDYSEKLKLQQADLNEQPEDIVKWKRGKVLKWAEETMREQTALTRETRWQAFPLLILEFMFGVYGIASFLDDPTVSEIFLDGEQQVRTRSRDGGRITRHPPITRSREEFTALCRNWVDAFGGNNERFDHDSPAANVTLPNGDRMHILGFLGKKPAHVTVRRHDFSVSTLDVIVENGTLSRQMANLLKAATIGKANMIIGGATGSGKTTLLRCMLSEVEENERVLVVEDTAEIGNDYIHPGKWNVELESRKPNIEGKGAITMERILVETLRMTPDRVIVGEVRGSEVTPMLLSMSQGNDGSLATIHSNSAAEVVTRLHTLMALFSEHNLSDASVLRLIGQAVDAVVYMERVGDGPKLTEIVTLDSNQTTDDGRPAITHIAKWNPATGKAEPQTRKEIPERLHRKLSAGGWKGWGYQADEMGDV